MRILDSDSPEGSKTPRARPITASRSKSPCIDLRLKQRRFCNHFGDLDDFGFLRKRYGNLIGSVRDLAVGGAPERLPQKVLDAMTQLGDPHSQHSG